MGTTCESGGWVMANCTSLRSGVVMLFGALQVSSCCSRGGCAFRVCFLVVRLARWGVVIKGSRGLVRNVLRVG